VPVTGDLVCQTAASRRFRGTCPADIDRARLRGEGRDSSGPEGAEEASLAPGVECHEPISRRRGTGYLEEAGAATGTCLAFFSSLVQAVAFFQLAGHTAAERAAFGN